LACARISPVIHQPSKDTQPPGTATINLGRGARGKTTKFPSLSSPSARCCATTANVTQYLLLLVLDLDYRVVDFARRQVPGTIVDHAGGIFD
jgi:hypothetical protein